MKWRLLFVLLALVGVALIIWGALEGWLWRALGGLLAALLGGAGLFAHRTAAGAGVIVNEGAKALGAREVEQKPGPKVPRHDGLNTNEPHSVVGEKPRPKTPKHDSW